MQPNQRLLLSPEEYARFASAAESSVRSVAPTVLARLQERISKEFDLFLKNTVGPTLLERAAHCKYEACFSKMAFIAQKIGHEYIENIHEKYDLHHEYADGKFVSIETFVEGLYENLKNLGFGVEIGKVSVTISFGGANMSGDS